MSIWFLSLLFSLLLGITKQAYWSRGVFPPLDQSVLEDVSYVKPHPILEVGYLVIVPEMMFDCHGYITGWSAVTQFNSSETAISYFGHDITFQLWRPRTRGSGVYNFVGSQVLEFFNTTLRLGLNVTDGKQFFTFNESVKAKLFFQPGDVIGWYVHRDVQRVHRPLSVVFREMTSNSGNSNNPSPQPVDMYSIEIADVSTSTTRPPCEVSLDSCSKNFTRYSSVIPYVTVNFGKYIMILLIRAAISLSHQLCTSYYKQHIAR